jgi:hypothetical protein
MAHYASSALSVALRLWNRNSYQVPYITALCTHSAGSDLNSASWETLRIAVIISTHSGNITSIVIKVKENVQNRPK